MQLMPGSPFNDEKLTPEMRASLYAKYGLDPVSYTHLGFNEPGEAFELETHCVNLTAETIEANKRFFDGNVDLVPKQAYTCLLYTSRCV